MTTDAVFSGSIPSLYDKYLGPLIFETYAEDLAKRLAALNAEHVLETAAGTGIVTRALLRSLPAGASIVATDLNQPMLDHAAGQVPSGRVSWQTADAQALPFPDRSFDAVVCQFGVMFFPDKQQSYREARRVLKPGGHFIFNVWDKIENNDFPNHIADALAELFADDPPRFLARTPYGYHDKQAVIDELRSAGFGKVAVETVTRRSVAPNCRNAVIGFVQGSPLRSEIEVRGADRLAEATEAAALRIAQQFGQGPVDGMIQAHVFTASD
jgi:ubiquinone/menaquinone biosynthesis C-methylase UbiE